MRTSAWAGLALLPLAALGPACGDPPTPARRAAKPAAPALAEARAVGSGTVSNLPPVPAAAVDAGANPRHLVLISVDTLRADHLGCMGHPWVKTPEIDALCAQGVVFEQHISAAPTTLASHASMLTGTWPHTHGVPRNGFLVDEGNLTLAELAQQGGFTTAAFVAAFPLDPRFGLGQGFHHYDADFDTRFTPGANQQAQRRADAVTDAALRFASSRDPEKERLLLFVHYFDVHAPYTPPAPWDRMYRSPGDGKATGKLSDIRRARRALAEGRPGGRLQGLLKKQYAAGVSYVDSEVGRLLRGLGPVADNAVVVLTADHGEAMDEGREHWNHGHTVLEGAIHTPLIVRAPGHAPRRVGEVASAIDLTPTLLDLLGLPPSPQAEGQSLRAAMAGGPTGREVTFAEATKPHERAVGEPWPNLPLCRAARTKGEKLGLCPAEGASALHLLPDETTDRQADLPEVAAALRAELAAWDAAAAPRAVAQDRGEGVAELLGALGYVEGAGADDEADDPPGSPEDE